MKTGNCLIAQSGGPTAAINATLAGVYSSAKKNSAIEKIYGGRNGIEGILKGNLVDLEEILEIGNNLKILKTTPSSFLGSCRYKLKGEQEFEKLFQLFEEKNIKFFFYIGGNDSMDTILQFKKYQEKKGGDITFIGVPKTIDNDLTCIDHTPGFGSAAKYIATTIKEIAADATVYSMKSAMVVEVMGRNAGWLALSAGLARDSKDNCVADLIYLPEYAFDKEKFLKDIEVAFETKEQIVVVVSEGLKNTEGKLLSESESRDSFGHSRLGGVARYIEEIITESMAIRVRSIELSVLQRAASHCLSATDVNESFMLGEKAVELASNGENGVMVTTVRTEGLVYGVELGCTDVERIANKEKTVPDSYMNEAKNQISQEGIDYIRPLIQGEVYVDMEHGVPKHLILREFL